MDMKNIRCASVISSWAIMAIRLRGADTPVKASSELGETVRLQQTLAGLRKLELIAVDKEIESHTCSFR
jgi:hypothetical protein